MIARTHHVIDARFLNLGLLPAKSDAPPALIIRAAALQVCVPGIGRLVIEASRLNGCRFVERARHSGLGKAFGDRRMAGGALAAEHGAAGQAGGDEKAEAIHEGSLSPSSL